MTQEKTGVLLVNLGTPKSSSPKDVYRYLIEFLTDPRVIDYPAWARQLLVRGLIVPLRYKRSARQYQAIWTKDGSPLMVYGKKVAQGLQSELGPEFKVALAMRYQGPTIEEGIQNLLKEEVTSIVVVPLFPQYASATTGSVHQKVMEVMSQELSLPRLIFVDGYASHPSFIDALASVAQNYNLKDYDHHLFSFHGIPERHIRKADRSNSCLVDGKCCDKITTKNHSCYRAQCMSTARLLAKRLDLDEGTWSASFQSRLGREKWLTPYTTEELRLLAERGIKRLLVYSPAFVCDCLETLFEIQEEYAEEFIQYGGEKLQLVQGLNAHPAWIHALKDIVLDHSPNRSEPVEGVELSQQPLWN